MVLNYLKYGFVSNMRKHYSGEVRLRFQISRFANRKSGGLETIEIEILRNFMYGSDIPTQ